VNTVGGKARTHISMRVFTRGIIGGRLFFPFSGAMKGTEAEIFEISAHRNFVSERLKPNVFPSVVTQWPSLGAAFCDLNNIYLLFPD
jgi:hypothetical protein